MSHASSLQVPRDCGQADLFPQAPTPSRPAGSSPKSWQPLAPRVQVVCQQRPGPIPALRELIAAIAGQCPAGRGRPAARVQDRAHQPAPMSRVYFQQEHNQGAAWRGGYRHPASYLPQGASIVVRPSQNHLEHIGAAPALSHRSLACWGSHQHPSCLSDAPVLQAQRGHLCLDPDTPEEGFPILCKLLLISWGACSPKQCRA